MAKYIDADKTKLSVLSTAEALKALMEDKRMSKNVDNVVAMIIGVINDQPEADVFDRAMIEMTEEWRKWCNKIPDLHFDPDWNIRIIPPFAGALARFVVSKGDVRVSVYFDAYANLGYMYDENDNPIPYFEIYPAPDGDVKRYYLDETETMLNDIRAVLEADRVNKS